MIPKGMGIGVSLGIGAKQLRPSRPPSLFLFFPSRMESSRWYVSSFEDYVMRWMVRSRTRRFAPYFRSPRFLAREGTRCWRFLLALKQQSSLVPRSTVVRARNCKHFQRSWNLVVEFCHWLQIAHLSWKCLVRVCRRLENVIRMFYRYERSLLYASGRFGLGNSGFTNERLSFLSCSFITLSNSQNSEEVWYLCLEENANTQVWSLLVFETYFESRPIFLAFLRLTKRGRGVFVAPDSVVFARIFPVWLRNAGYDEFVTLPYNFRHSYNRTSTYARPHLIEGLNFRVKRSHPISQLSPLVAFTF